MPTTPTGIISQPVDVARTMLCACPEFQSWVGESNADGAKRHTYLYGLPLPEDEKGYTVDELERYRPYCMLFLEPVHGWEGRKIGEGAYVNSGRVVLHFEEDIADENTLDIEEAMILFTNRVGQVITELLGVSGGGGYVSIHAARTLKGPSRGPVEKTVTMGEFQWVQIALEWGV